MTNELALILACCRPVGDPDRLAHVRAAAGAGFDPDILLATARGHRVEGFVEQALRAGGITLPPAASALLSDRVRRARLQLLRNTAEELRVTRALVADGVDVVSIKGATLAMLAQGSLALKSAWDVDLLVRPGARARADAVLSALGYRSAILDGRRSPREVERYRAGVKEIVWRHPDRDTTIELHTALFDARHHLTAVGPDSPRTPIDLPGGGRVETIAPGPLFAYLAVHGSHHGWMRVKWLADVAGLLHRHPGAADDWHRQAIAAGAERASAVTLTLAHRLLGVALPAALLERFARDRPVARLVTLATRLIEGSRSDEQSVLRPSLAQYLTLFGLSLRLAPGWRGSLATLLAQLGKPYHPHHLKVPSALLPVLMLGWLPFRIASRPRRS